MKTLALLFGGPSDEYEVSLASAAAVLSHLDRRHYRVYAIGVTRDGRWLETDATPEAIRRDTWQETTCVPVCFPHDRTRREMCRFTTNGVLERVKIDVIFPVMHGQFVEDGRLQGLLAMTGIPFVGCETQAAAIAMDKAVTKTLLSAAGLPVVPFFLWDACTGTGGDALSRPVREVRDRFAYPVFVKPARAGSSVGAHKVATEADLAEALRDAARIDSRVLVEPFVEAREIEVAVLDTPDGREVSRCGEIEPHAAFYDYRAKYRDTGSVLHTEAALSPALSERIRHLAGKAFSCLGCRGLARVDFFLTRAGDRLYINEINTMPGFTDISMFPKLATRTRSFTDLLTLLLEGAQA